MSEEAEKTRRDDGIRDYWAMVLNNKTGRWHAGEWPDLSLREALKLDESEYADWVEQAKVPDRLVEFWWRRVLAAPPIAWEI